MVQTTVQVLLQRVPCGSGFGVGADVVRVNVVGLVRRTPVREPNACVLVEQHMQRGGLHSLC